MESDFSSFEMDEVVIEEKLSKVEKTISVSMDQQPDDALIVLGHQIKELSKSLRKLDHYLKGIEDILPS